MWKIKRKPEFITDKLRGAMKKREKEFVFLLYERRYTRKQIIDKLFIESERTFQRLQKKISYMIKRHNVPH